VEGRQNVVLAFERILQPETGTPVLPETGDREAKLNISVIFTSVASTLNALKRAGALAARFGARITLLVPQVVPFPMPLESPPVLLDWSERRFRVIAERSPVETTVQIFLCRDRLETLVSVLRAGSIVVLGAPHRWWPTAEARLARKLRKSGHEVILAEME
jgi:hypothetical protein